MPISFYYLVTNAKKVTVTVLYSKTNQNFSSKMSFQSEQSRCNGSPKQPQCRGLNGRECPAQPSLNPLSGKGTEYCTLCYRNHMMFTNANIRCIVPDCSICCKMNVPHVLCNNYQYVPHTPRTPRNNYQHVPHVPHASRNNYQRMPHAPLNNSKCEVADCFNQPMQNSTFCSHYCQTRTLILAPGYCYCGWKLISAVSSELQKPMNLCPQNMFHNQVREYFASRGRVVEGMYVPVYST